MRIDPQTWPTLSQLLDTWLDLPEDSRPGWLENLAPEYAGFMPALRELLAHHGIHAGDIVLDTLPSFQYPSDAADRFASGTRVGPYRLIRELGCGGMGDVWLAERADGAFKRTVALKLPTICLQRAGLRERFARERDILAQLVYSRIARLYDAGIADGEQPYLAMEYVDGEVITTYSDQHRLGIRPRLRLFLEVLAAVQYAHTNLVVHRDLKPANILVTRDGEIRLLDFGIAKLLTQGEAEETQLTQMGDVVLTPDYASPEQITGGLITTASDVYSLGVVLYELLTGERPYRLKRDGGRSLAEAIIATDPIRPSQAVKLEQKAHARSLSVKRLAHELNGDLDAIVLKAIEKQPARRYATVDAFAQDIACYLKGEAIRAQRAKAWRRAEKFVRRNWLAVSSAAAVLCALTIGLAIASWQTRLALVEKHRADTEASAAKAVTDFLENDLLARASPYTAGPSDKPDPDLKLRTAVDRAAARIEGKFARQPLVEASIRHTISRVYDDLGLYSEAERQIQRTTALRRRALGDTHRDTLSSMWRLAVIYRDRGKYADAESVAADVLPAQVRALGERDPDTIKTMATLAGAQAFQRKFAAAEALYGKALPLSREVFGDDHPQTLSIMNDLGPMYQSERKYPEAFSTLTKALEIERRVLGEEHPDTIETAYNLGTISLYYGKYAEARPLLIKARDIWLRTLGEAHPLSMLSAGVFGTFYLYLGRYKEAEAVYTKVLEIRTRVLGQDHASTLETMINLGRVYADLGKFAQGERLLNDVIVAQRRLGLQVFRASSALAYVYMCAGKEAEAESMLRSVIEDQRRALGDNHSNTLDSMNYLAEVYVRRADQSEAEQILTKAIELRQSIAASENVFLADARRTLGQLRLQQGRYSDAESLLHEALAAYDQAGSESWARYESQVLLGAALMAQCRSEEGRRLLVSGRLGLLERRDTIPVYGRPMLRNAEKWISQPKCQMD